VAKKYKDNIIEFPTKHKPSNKFMLQTIEARIGEIELENDMMRADIDYLSGAINKNVSELEDLLKQMSLLAGLEKPIVELKEDEHGQMEFEFNLGQLDDILNNKNDKEED
tara:strand:+ start:1376 stop:1705 length:330 start_codon:yes stop_codon:yes gene_type:complete